MAKDSPEAHRKRAAHYHQLGRTHLAEAHEHRARELELLVEMRTRAVTKTITVKGKRYRVGLNYNDEGEWYANAHTSSSVFPDAYVEGYPDMESCLQAVKNYLKEK